MNSITARNIALISSANTAFAALGKASSFAAQIIEKYSDTDAYPFTDEALVFLKKVNEQIGDERDVKNNVNYTLRLMIIQRLILEGKISDPTVTKTFLPSVEQRIEQNLSLLKHTDFKAFTDVNKALTYIKNADNISDSIVLTEVVDGSQTFRYSSLNLNTLNKFINEEQSDSTVINYNYAYNDLPAIIFKKEKIADNPNAVPAPVKSESADTQADTVVNVSDDEYNYSDEELTLKTNAETNVINVSDEDYNYTNEELTLREEGDSSSVTDIQNNTVINKNENAGGQTEVSNTFVSNEASSDNVTAGQNVNNVALLVMNSFMSGGSSYISDIENKYNHKRITLIPVSSTENFSELNTFLNEPSSAFSTVTHAVNMLVANGELTPYEQTIYDNSVKLVFRETHEHESALSNITTKEMLSKMSAAERTKVLSIVVNRLTGDESTSVSGVGRRQGKPVKAKVNARLTGSRRETEFIRLLERNIPRITTDLVQKAAKQGNLSSQLFKLFAYDGGEYQNSQYFTDETVMYMPSLIKYFRGNVFNGNTALNNSSVVNGTDSRSISQNQANYNENAFYSNDYNYNNNRVYANSYSNVYNNNYAQNQNAVNSPVNNYSVNTTVHLRTLPEILVPESAENQNADTYINVNTPEKRHKDVVNAIRQLTKTVMQGSSAPQGAVPDAQNTVNNAYYSQTANIHSAVSVENENSYDYSSMGAGVELKYHEPTASMFAPPDAPNRNAQPQITQQELIQQFGNLIEGADAGMNTTYNAFEGDVDNAMVVLEATAEKVAENSKLIEEIREEQRKMEAVTLKSSDMDTISNEMIKRLRTRLRFDKSRFTS